MSPEMRKRHDEQQQQRKEKIFEHIKYNMNSNRPGKTSPLTFVLMAFSLGCTMGQIEGGKVGLSTCAN